MRPRGTWPAPIVLLGLAGFWVGVLVAAALEPGYAHRRDYVSTLASRGAEHGWLGVAAIASAGAAIGFSALVVRRWSRIGAVALASAGAGFVVVAFTRLECANGAAGCGLGGRFAISGSTEVTHWTATTVSTVLVVAAIALTGVALWRAGRKVAGGVTLVVAAVTAASFLVMGGQSPGGAQRLGIAVATGWLAAVSAAALAHRGAERS